MTREDITNNQTLIIIAIMAVALNLRPAIAAIGPLADIIETYTALNSSGVGLLSTLPIFFMGLGALCVRFLRYLLGETRGISVGIGIISASCIGRFWLHTDIGLIITAIGAGIGIATVQALMPAFIKRSFSIDAGRIIGFYSSAIVGGAVVAAATTAEFAHFFGWVNALTFWGVPAITGLALWLFMQTTHNNNQPAAATNTAPNTHYWQHSRSWSLLVFFGIGTGAFMLILAWLPAFYVALGKSQEFSGYLLASFTLIELVTALIISTYINRYPDRRAPLLIALILVIAGLVCLITAPLQLTAIAIGLLGIGIGLLFPLSLIITVDHVNDPKQAGDFSAFVTGGGYIIASIMPLLAGWIRDQFADLTQAWVVMALGIGLLIIMAIRYSPESYLHFRQKSNSQ